jgi:hypothetical protein
VLRVQPTLDFGINDPVNTFLHISHATECLAIKSISIFGCINVGFFLVDEEEHPKNLSKRPFNVNGNLFTADYKV